MAELCEAVVTAISSNRYRFTSEDELQRGIDLALIRHGIVADREVRLAPGDIIDFLAGDVGVEVKVDGSPQSIARQLMRYAGSPRVASLVLVTRKAQHANRFPPSIGGKPLRIVSLGDSSL
jgi:hypothetical protein